MNKNKKGRSKDSKKSVSNATRVTPIENTVITEQDKNMISFVTTFRKPEAAGNSQSSGNPSQNLADTKREKKGNFDSSSFDDASMQSDSKVAKHLNVKSTGKASDKATSDNQALASSAEGSKKKVRSREKNASDISRREPITGAEHEEFKLYTSNSILLDPEFQKSLDAQLARIKSGEAGPKPIKFRQKYKMNQSPSNEVQKIKAANAGNENIQNSPKDKLTSESANVGKVDDPIIHVKQEIALSPSGIYRVVKQTETITPVTKQTGAKEAESMKETPKGKKGDNHASNIQEIALPLKKSKKNRNRDRSQTVTSRTESLKSAEFEKNKHERVDTILYKGVDTRESPSTEIAVTDMEANESKTLLSMDDGEMKCAVDREGNLFFYMEGEDIEGYLENSQKVIRPVIFVTEKSTQTDPLPETGNISKSSSDRNITESNYDSDTTIIDYAPESALVHPPRESKENTPEDSDISKKTGSNLSSRDEVSQSIKEDYLRDLKMMHENFEACFMNCFERENFSS